MTRAKPSAEDRVAALAQLDLAALRDQWVALHGRPAPVRLGRDLLVRAVAYGIQAEERGGLPPALRRRLKRLCGGGGGQATQAAVMRLQPGVRLMREWNGETHVVDVLADGYHWNGEHYHSLSAVARAITGARWSGPRFFGLHETTRSSDLGRESSP